LLFVLLNLITENLYFLPIRPPPLLIKNELLHCPLRSIFKAELLCLLCHPFIAAWRRVIQAVFFLSSFLVLPSYLFGWRHIFHRMLANSRRPFCLSTQSASQGLQAASNAKSIVSV
jgi:hypothetical protein